MFDVTESQNSNMAAAKPEVLISQLLEETERKSNGYPYVFGVKEHEYANMDVTLSNRKSEIQDGGFMVGFPTSGLVRQHS